MPIIAIDTLELNPHLHQRLMGLDLGDTTIGIALSDTRGRIATPLKTLIGKEREHGVRTLVNLIEEHNVAALIVGMPYNMNGSEGERCVITRAFVNRLFLTLDIPVALWDERLTTRAATLGMRDGKLSAKKQEKSIDRVAATLILQGALDFLNQAN